MSKFFTFFIVDRAGLPMAQKTPFFLSILLGMCLSHAAVAAESKAPSVTLSAAQIVDKHIAARGGLQAWHEVQTLSVAGKMDAGTGDSAARSAILAKAGAGASVRRPAGGAAAGPERPTEKPQVQLPFRLEMKRPRKSRLEIDFAGKTAVQVYDGQNGWKLRPYLNRNDVEPFSEQEAKAQSDTGELEGPLVDYAAKGTKIALEGMEPVEGHNAYKLMLTRKSGDVQHIWIDAQSFLDVKIEGIPRRMDGKMHKVWISQRDFRLVQGVMIPFVVETVVEGYRETHKMLIEKVTLNQKLDDAAFGKPAA
jgi:outer membrane lipoprotein-sorting protein